MMEHREKIRRKKSKTAAFCPLLAKLRAATKENGEDIMNIGYLESIFSFLGGLGMFLYGMSIMGDGMQKSAGSKLNKFLRMVTDNRLLAVGLGALITAILHSSGATTVMVVGFVNAGIPNLTQAVGVIMGANIGTTITAWLVSLSEFGSVLNPEFYAPLLLGIGAFVILFTKSEKKKQIGEILIGFAILFIGLSFMSDAIKPYRDSPVFSNAFTVLGKNPVLAILTGTVVTAIIQSSSASVGILQTLAMNGIVNWKSAVFITLGQNIGTCVTALLSGVGSGRNGKRASVIHLSFNVIGAVLFGIIMYVLFWFFPAWGASTMSSVDISIFHTVFNITCTVVLLPFAEKLVWVSGKLVPGAEETEDELEGSEARKMAKRLDSRVLGNPLFALATVVQEVSVMGHATCQNLVRLRPVRRNWRMPV